MAEDFPRQYAYFTAAKVLAAKVLYAEQAMGPVASKLRAEIT